MSTTILCDMDGVLVDTLPLWLAEFNHSLPNQEISIDAITSYNFTDHPLIAKHASKFFGVLEDKQVFANAPPLYPTFYELANRLYSAQNDAYLVTYVHPSCPSGEQQKRQWLSQHMPWFDQSKIIFCKDKHLVRGDILYEDNPTVIDSWLRANPKGFANMVVHTYNRSMIKLLESEFLGRIQFVEGEKR